jgi:hypothetical protein
MARKLLALVLVVSFLMGLGTVTVAADDVVEIVTTESYEQEYLAAPNVAGILLEQAGIDNRYGQGKDGGNYIRDVAAFMGPETDFGGISKEDVVCYECAVAAFLREKGAAVVSQYDGVLDPAQSFATATDNADGTVTLSIVVRDLCGNPITGLDPTSDFFVRDSVISGDFYFGTGSIPGSELANWTIVDGTYTITLQRNYFNARPAGYDDGWYRIWHIFVLGECVEADLKLSTTYWMVGDWKMDLYVGSTLHERFVVIATHKDGDIAGFFGVGYDPEGAPTGSITGWVDGQTVYMFYDRTGYVDTGYTAEFWGNIANDGNSMGGNWADYDRGDISQTWTMVRQ